MQALREMASTEAAPAAAAAREPIVTSGKKGVTLTISGQVNRAALLFEDGNKSHLTHVDNDNSSTRVRLVGEGRFSERFMLGAQVEVEFESNSSASVNQFMEHGVRPDNFTKRKLEVYLDSTRFGRLWLGQGDTASNITSEVDLSATRVITNSGVHDLAGGVIFRDAPGQPVPTDVTVGGAFSNLDGLSRDDRVRYDTPTWKGFQLSTSHIAGGAWDVAGRFSGKLLDSKLAAAIAYWSRPGSDGINGSVSALHASGLNLTLAAGSRDFGAAGRLSSTFWYIKGGYLAELFGGIGKTGFTIDYFAGEDQAANGDEGTSYGASMVQKIDRISTELYVGGRVYELDRPGRSFDDIIAVQAGARIKF